MASGILEIPLFDSAVIPYCGIGIGQSWDREHFGLEPVTIEGRVYFFDDYVERRQGLACHGIIGFIFSTGNKIQAGVEYRYLDGSQTHVNHTLDLNLKRYF